MIQLQSLRNFSLINIFKIILALGLVSMTWLGFQYLWLGVEVNASKVIQQDFVQTIVASGHVENPNRIELGAQITGTVAKVPVKEGQAVKAGQVLIELENSEMQAALQQANANLMQAQAKMRQLQEVQTPVADSALKQATINHQTSQKALSRAQELFNKGFVGQAALDEAHRAEQVAKAQTTILQEQLNSVLPKGSEYYLTQANLAQAAAGAELAKSKLRYARVLAPASGTLILRNVETGDVVQPGKVLMMLSPDGITELVLQIDEKHLRQLKIGQMAKASADAYSTAQFAAELAFINPGVDAQRGAVLVKLKVLQAPPYLKQDMTVSVNIEVAKKEHAILVTSDAIHDIDAAAWIQKVVNDRVVHQPIKIGLRGGIYSEVLEGLSPGDIALRDSAVIGEKKRVRVKLLPVKS